jgi:two-component system chemotaxis sensor kinase CheA
VTDVSGRGVGMDVVKKQHHRAAAARWRSTPAEGYGMTVRVRLPLTLAIIDGFLTMVGRCALSCCRWAW